MMSTGYGIGGEANKRAEGRGSFWQELYDPFWAKKHTERASRK
jgi:hypothetical protein